MKRYQQREIRHIIDAAGGAAKLAAELDLTRQTVHNWTQVPADRVLRVEQITGIPREEIRLDVFTIQPVVRKLVGAALDQHKKKQKKLARIAARRKRVAS